jgi:uncharacterized repeat protein (TIGR02543 family)
MSSQIISHRKSWRVIAVFTVLAVLLCYMPHAVMDSYAAGNAWSSSNDSDLPTGLSYDGTAKTWTVTGNATIGAEDSLAIAADEKLIVSEEALLTVEGEITGKVTGVNSTDGKWGRIKIGDNFNLMLDNIDVLVFGADSGSGDTTVALETGHLYLGDGKVFGLPDGFEFVLAASGGGDNTIDGNVTITGKFTIADDVTLEVNDNAALTVDGTLDVGEGELSIGSAQLILTKDSVLNIGEDSTVTVTTGATPEILVLDGAIVNTPENYTDIDSYTKEAYTVKFVDYNGATDLVVGSGEKATKPADPTLAGYTFLGWYAGDADTSFDFNDTITADTILYAQYSKNDWSSSNIVGLPTGLGYDDDTKTWTLTADAIIGAEDSLTIAADEKLVLNADKVLTVNGTITGKVTGVENLNGASEWGRIQLSGTFRPQLDNRDVLNFGVDEDGNKTIRLQDASPDDPGHMYFPTGANFVIPDGYEYIIAVTGENTFEDDVKFGGKVTIAEGSTLKAAATSSVTAENAKLIVSEEALLTVEGEITGKVTGVNSSGENWGRVKIGDNFNLMLDNIDVLGFGAASGSDDTTVALETGHLSLGNGKVFGLQDGFEFVLAASDGENAVNGNVTITGKFTIDDNIELKVKDDATLTLADGAVLTIGSGAKVTVGTDAEVVKVGTASIAGAGGIVDSSGDDFIPTQAYTVKFVDWNGATLKTQIVEKGNAATSPANPTRAGYTFTGWLPAFTNITADLTVTAQYTIISYPPAVYPVTFDANGDGVTGVTGVPAEPQNVNNNATATRPTPDPTSTSHDFVGWYVDAAGTAAFDFATPITAATTIYAKWAIKIKTFTVTFKDWDGATLKTETVNDGDPATAPTAPARPGWNFTDWNPAAFSSIKADTVVTAEYEPVQTVKNAKPITASISAAKPVASPGKAYALPSTIDFGGGFKSDVKWTTSNSMIATVSGATLKGIGEGTVTLTATSVADAGKKASITVTIAKNVTKVRTPFTTIYVKKGKAITPPVLSDSINAAGKADTAAKLTWKSSNTKIATVNAAGKITPKKTGTAKITATALNGKTLTITVKVVSKAAALKKIKVSGAPSSLKTGATKQLTVKPAQTKATNLVVKFKSSKPSVLKVDKAGKLTAVKKGKAKITVSIGKIKYTKTITVK